MQHIVQTYRLPVLEKDDAGVMVGISYEGVEHRVVAACTLDGEVLLRAMSNIRFDELPKAMFGPLERLNRQMTRCSYWTHHDARGSWFTVDAKTTVAQLTAEEYAALTAH